MIKAIDTNYGGYRFRSRTEAKWAVLFDTLRLRYSYEPEGFVLDGIPYLPDFLISDSKTGQGSFWVEIKGQKSTHEEKLKCSLLARESGLDVVLLEGPPRITRWPEYGTHVFSAYREPFLTDGRYELYFEESRDNSLARFLTEQGYRIDYDLKGEAWRRHLLDFDCDYYLKKYNRPHFNWQYLINFDVYGKVFVSPDEASPYHTTSREAYAIANGWRFEHGENPT